MNNVKPNISNINFSDCKEFVHLPDDKRKGKLDKKSTQCIFVGYPNNSKGFKTVQLIIKANC